MEKIRTANGGILFLEDEDYMPKLLAYLRETAGYDAAEAVEEWAEEVKEELGEKLADIDSHHEAYRAELQNRVTNLEALLNDERDAHLEEITELEEELVSLAETNGRLLTTNFELTRLLKEEYGWPETMERRREHPPVTNPYPEGPSDGYPG